MTKQGNWGTWAIIKKPKKPQKMENISCELCASYDSRVKKCSKDSECIPNESWKSCKKFYFKSKYDTARYWNESVNRKHSVRWFQLCVEIAFFIYSRKFDKEQENE